jgi:uncharacterized protein YodC (DUF2158 family)
MRTRYLPPLLAVLALSTGAPASAGAVDGIWLEAGMPHCYWFVRENAGTLVMAQLCNEPAPAYYAGYWEVTLVGGIVGNVAHVSWNVSTASGTATVTFTSETTATLRNDTCTVKSGGPASDCDPTGSSVALTKFF